MNFKNYKIDEFICDLASDLSSPGGGSVAALVTALASALDSMVYSFTIDKKTFESLNSEQKEKMIKLSEESKVLIQEALVYMDKDRDAFTSLMDCYKLPKETDDDKKIRGEKILENTIVSMNVPLELAEKAIKFYENIEFAIKYGNKNLASDGVVAAILLHSSIEAAVVNVKVNYFSIKNKESVSFILDRCKELLNESLERKSKIVESFEG